MTGATFAGRESKLEFPISTLSLRGTICRPPSRFKPRSPWPRLGDFAGWMPASSICGRSALRCSATVGTLISLGAWQTSAPCCTAPASAPLRAMLRCRVRVSHGGLDVRVPHQLLQSREVHLRHCRPRAKHVLEIIETTRWADACLPQSCLVRLCIVVMGFSGSRLSRNR
jgi:hypothetical protein